jgi:hypothetical protein
MSLRTKTRKARRAERFSRRAENNDERFGVVADVGQRLSIRLRDFMKRCGIPGLGMAFAKDGRIVYA